MRSGPQTPFSFSGGSPTCLLSVPQTLLAAPQSGPFYLERVPPLPPFLWLTCFTLGISTWMTLSRRPPQYAEVSPLPSSMAPTAIWMILISDHNSVFVCVVISLRNIFPPNQPASPTGETTMFCFIHIRSLSILCQAPSQRFSAIPLGQWNKCINSKLELYAYFWSLRKEIIDVFWAFTLSGMGLSALHCLLAQVCIMYRR